MGYKWCNDSAVTLRESSMDYTHNNYNRSSDADHPVRVGIRLVSTNLDEPAGKRMQECMTCTSLIRSFPDLISSAFITSMQYNAILKSNLCWGWLGLGQRLDMHQTFLNAMLIP